MFKCFAIDCWHVANAKVPKKVFGVDGGQSKKYTKCKNLLVNTIFIYVLYAARVGLTGCNVFFF